MLIGRDLRDRVIGLVGHGRLTVTTKALDEAGERISRYLLMQLAVNGGYGAAVAVALYVSLWIPRDCVASVRDGDRERALLQMRRVLKAEVRTGRAAVADTRWAG